MIKAWTYKTSPAQGPYWRSSTPDGEIILLEYPDQRLEWRLVSTGKVARKTGPPSSGHKGKLLAKVYYPQWLVDMDDYEMDEGL